MLIIIFFLVVEVTYALLSVTLYLGCFPLFPSTTISTAARSLNALQEIKQCIQIGAGVRALEYEKRYCLVWIQKKSSFHNE